MEIKIDKKTLKRVLIIAVLCILAVWILNSPSQLTSVFSVLERIFAPFAVGLAFAFIINVPMRWIEGKMKGIKHAKVRRVMAMILAYLLVVLILTGVLWLLIPELIKTINDLIPLLLNFVSKLEAQVEKLLADNPKLSELLGSAANFDWTDLLQKGIAFLEKWMTSILSKTWGAVLSIGGFFINAFIAIIFATYVLFQKEVLARQGRRLLYAFFPEKFADGAVHILQLSNGAFSRFISGQCIEVCILGSMFAVTMAIFGMPFIPLICVLIAVTAFVPYVGAWIGCIVGTFLIMVVDPSKAVWFALMFLILQQIENNLIYPKVVGTSIGLSGMWVLLAIAVGGELFGVIGMIVMIPIASVIYTVLSEVTRKRLEKRNIATEKLEAQEPRIPKRRKEKKLKFTSNIDE